MEPIELCTRLIESVDNNTRLLVGALLTIAVQLMVIVKQWLETRKAAKS